MPKLYTKTGDEGKTSLYDGNRIGKGELFFSVLGDLDELSSHIGMLCSMMDSNDLSVGILRNIQVNLLTIGSNIAVVDRDRKISKITIEDVKNIEKNIDICDGKNEKLTEFLLPGYSKEDSQCHICRSVCRRVERGLWKLHRAVGVVDGKRPINMLDVNVDSNILVYMNRLSDFFFAFSRNLSCGMDVKVSDIKRKLVKI